MKEKIYIPGPAKVMYAVYAAALTLAVYSGFNRNHPFVSGWRFPWSPELMNTFNFITVWVLALVSFVYLYYALLGKPRDSGWSEPLGIFRIILALVALWFFFFSFAIYQPTGWLSGLISFFGGPAKALKWYELFLWAVLLLNLIYLYVRWAKSERFPRLTAPKKAK
jgi:hypothetical protein